MTLLLTGGCDGKVRVMKDSPLATNEICCLQSTLACIDIGSPVTSLAALKGYPVCAVGSADGVVRFIHVGKNKDRNEAEIPGNIPIDIIVLKSEVLSFTPITSLDFASKTKKLVAGCFESGKAFVLCTEPTNLHVLGVVETPDKSPLCSTCWCTQNSSHLIIASQSGSISCFDTISMCFSPDPLRPIWEISLDDISHIRGVAILEHDEDKIAYVVHPDIKGFHSFEIKSEKAEVDKKNSHIFSANQCSCIFMEDPFLMVGSKGGEIFIFQFKNDKTLQQITTMKAHAGPVLAMTMSADQSRLYSSSIDGTLKVFSVSTPKDILQSAYEYDYLVRIAFDIFS